MNAVICYLRSYSNERHLRGGKRIKYIQLRDNSIMQRRGVSIRLADYYTLTRGTTYYDRFGFVPYDLEYEFVDVEGVKELEQNKRMIRKQTIKRNLWFFEKFPQCRSEYTKQIDSGKIDPETTSIGEPIRYMFQNFPQIIHPEIKELQKKLHLVSLSNRGWALLLRSGTKFSDQCARRQAILDQK
jgi:hypothetical protein